MLENYFQEFLNLIYYIILLFTGYWSGVQGLNACKLYSLRTKHLILEPPDQCFKEKDYKGKADVESFSYPFLRSQLFSEFYGC